MFTKIINVKLVNTNGTYTNVVDNFSLSGTEEKAVSYTLTVMKDIRNRLIEEVKVTTTTTVQ